MAATANTPIIVNSPAPRGGAGDLLIKAALVGGLFWFGRKAYQEYRSRQTEAKVGSDPNVQFATEIHQAIDGAGTSEKVLFNVIGKITDFAAVTKEYRKLYNASILDDIKGDLSPEDYNKFLNIMNLRKVDDKGKPLPGKNVIAAGLLVTAEKAVYLRKAPVYIKVLPDLMYATNPLLKRNHIALVPASKNVGITTGNYSDDTNSPDATRYLEVQVVAFNADNKTTLVKLWVASSQVKTKAVTKEELVKTVNQTNTVFLSQSQYKQSLKGLDSILPEKQVIASANSVSVYDENFFLVKEIIARPGIIMGSLIGTVTRNGKEYVKYLTVQDTVRVTPIEEVKTINQ